MYGHPTSSIRMHTELWGIGQVNSMPDSRSSFQSQAQQRTEQAAASRAVRQVGMVPGWVAGEGAAQAAARSRAGPVGRAAEGRPWQRRPALGGAARGAPEAGVAAAPRPSGGAKAWQASTCETQKWGCLLLLDCWGKCYCDISGLYFGRGFLFYIF